VAVTDDLVLTFSESIQKGTGTIAIHSGTYDGGVLESYDVAASTNITISGNESIKDIAGNNYADGADFYDFTTGADPYASSGGGISTGAVVLVLEELECLPGCYFRAPLFIVVRSPRTRRMERRNRSVHVVHEDFEHHPTQ